MTEEQKHYKESKARYKKQNKDLKKKKKAQKKLRKKQKKLLYKVQHQKKNPPKFVYLVECFFATLIDTLISILNFFLSIIIICLTFVLIGSGGIFFLTHTKILPEYYNYVDIAKDIVQDSSPDDFKIKEGSIIYDNRDRVIAKLYDTSFLTYSTYDEIPEDVVNAFVAVEDRTFWENDGVDYYGMARVLYRYAKTKGEEAHGASTITQQLARTVYLTRDVSLERKFKEICVAQELTKKYSKEQLMEFYVNNCCFANGIYGIEGAAQSYFGKKAKNLSLAQITYLCAIPNRPSYYDPYVDIDRAKTRQAKILKDMLTCGYITQEEYDNALEEEIVLKKTTTVFNDYQSSYAIDCAVRYLMQLDNYNFRYTFDSDEDYDLYKKQYDEDYAEYKNKLYTGGYRVYTTLDMDTYRMAQEKLDTVLEGYNTSINEETGIYNLQGALTIINNDNGKVEAVVGGRTQESENKVYSLNRAFQSYRQPGSSIKPLVVYTPALERGYTANSSVMNIDVSKAKEKGVDVQKLTGQQMTLRSAVEQSKNGVAWQIFDKITPSIGLSYITNMKFSHIVPSDYYDSAALGGLTYGVSTVEMTSAYCTLANNGYFVEPTCIRKMLDTNGEDIYKVSDRRTIIYTALAADTMVDICKGVLSVGTAKGLGWSRKTDTSAFGKTGTTNDNKDVWFCGATPYYSIAVWVGYDKPQPMKGVYGANYPATIWRDVMLDLIEDKETKDFYKLEEEYSNSDISIDGDRNKYLPGRAEEEVLSSGYTVADYRNDRLIGEQIQVIIDRMNNLKSTNYYSDLNELYSQGQALVDTIYSQKYTTEMRLKLQTTYENLYGANNEYVGTGNSNAITGNEVAPAETVQNEDTNIEMALSQ